MTHEEAIENLNYLMSDETTWTQYDCGEEIAMAVDALRKQIPKKPKIKYQQLHCLWCCDCGTYLGYKWDGFKYCPTCGQAIDWGEEEHDGENIQN